MRLSLTMLLIAIVVGIAADTANAGLKQTWPVVIDSVNRTASGSLGSARNNKSDSSQYIGCWTWASGTDTNQGGDGKTAAGCTAKNASGTAACAITRTGVGFGMSLLFGPMATDGLISFSWDANGNCTGIQFWSYGSLEPKKLVP